MSYRVLFFSKLRFITRTGTENLYIAEIQHFLRVINGDAKVLRLAICKLYPATYGLQGLRGTKDITSASLSAWGQLELMFWLFEISELDTKLATAVDAKLYGMVYHNT